MWICHQKQYLHSLRRIDTRAFNADGFILSVKTFALVALRTTLCSLPGCKNIIVNIALFFFCGGNNFFSHFPQIYFGVYPYLGIGGGMQGPVIQGFQDFFFSIELWPLTVRWIWWCAYGRISLICQISSLMPWLFGHVANRCLMKP